MTDAEDSAPRRVTGLKGKVTRGRFGTGSKSEREAIYFETQEGRFVLRRKGGPTFEDSALDRYVGKQVSCDGFLVDYTLLAERIEIQA